MELILEKWHKKVSERKNIFALLCRINKIIGSQELDKQRPFVYNGNVVKRLHISYFCNRFVTYSNIGFA